MSKVFRECDACRKRPASSPLCSGCRANYKSIVKLQQEVTKNEESKGYFGHPRGCDCNKCDMVGYWDI